LQDLEKEFMCFYVLTAVRKFFFFLDPKRTGKIFIKDILQSPLLRELHELKTENCTTEQLEVNWFTPTNAFRVYNQYVKLDLNQNGLLSKMELLQYNWGITKVFVDRVFEVT